MSDFVVGKAGGTSNAHAEAVAVSLEWAEQTDVFVPSAPGKLDEEGPHADKVTNMLLLARDEYESQGYVSSDKTGIITERYAAIVAGLGSTIIDGMWVDSIRLRVQEAARTSRDAASMLGERLMAEIYQKQGYTLLDPGRARHDLGSDAEAWRGWLEEAFQPGQRHVLVGNTTLSGGVLRTFSRGGSDTSGGFAAYGIRAGMNLNLTDGGAMSADPKLVGGDAQHLEHLLYLEGRGLGRNGTGILHPEAMVPLMIGNIPTEIRSTLDRSAPYTVIDNDIDRASARAGRVMALSLMNDVRVIRVHEPGMAEAIGRLDVFDSALAENGIAIIDSQGDGVDAQRYFVDSERAEKAESVLSANAATHAETEISDNMSFITLVGYKLETRIIDNIFELALNSGLRAKEWQQQGYPLSIGRHSIRIGVAPLEAGKLLERIHQAVIKQ